VRIAFLLPDFPRLSETFVLSQLQGLLERGHDVVVYARRPPPDVADEDARRRYATRVREQPPIATGRWKRTMRGLALTVRHAPRHPRLVASALDPTRFGRYALSFGLLHAAVPFFDRPSYDVIHCHFGPAAVYGVMLRAMGAIRGPLIASFYGHDVTRYPHERGDGVYRRLFAQADLVLALDPLMRRRLETLGADPARLALNPMGVDCDRFAPAAQTPAPPPPLQLLSVGRLVEKKGFGDGLRAVASLVERGVPVRYRIAGDGPLRAALERLATDLGIDGSVEFLGHTAHEAVPDLLRSSHALVAPSVRAADGDEEGTPLTIIEAMAAGLPVAATKHAGIPWAVADGTSGWLVEEGDAAGLGERLAGLLDPQVGTDMGAEGRRRAVARHGAAAMIDRLETAYEALTGDPATAARTLKESACSPPNDH
jgi:colanic acid/amylovoran biosynthesis glycosyltransferase